SVKIESSTMKPYMCRPGAIEIVTDQRSPCDARVIGDRTALQSLKSPTTDTRRADTFRNTNCCGIGKSSGAPLIAARTGVLVPASLDADVIAVLGVECTTVPRAKKPTIAAAATSPANPANRNRREPERGWNAASVVGSSAGGMTRCAAAASTTRRIAPTSAGGTSR